MISAVASIYFPLVSHISQQISPHYHGFHHFFRLSMSFMLALAFINFFLPVSKNNFQGNSLFNNAFRGLDLSSYPLGMVLWQLFSYVFYFSYNSFYLETAVQDVQSTKKTTHICSKQIHLDYHFSIGFNQLSELFQPFAIGFNQLSDLFHCFLHWMPAIFPIYYCPIFQNLTMGCHQLFNLFHQCLTFFLKVFKINIKITSCFKSALRGLDLTGYPLGMVLWLLFSLKFYCSRMHSEGFSFYIWGPGGGGVFVGRRFGVRNRSQTLATACNCPQPLATACNCLQPSSSDRLGIKLPCLWAVLHERSFFEFSSVAQLRFTWQSWHYVTCGRVS